MPTVGVIGLGSMGMGIARSALRAGLPVRGFDVDADRVEAFATAGGARGDLGAAGDLDIAVLVTVTAAQARDVLFGAGGLAAALRPGALVIACPTMSPGDARDLAARAGEAGLLYLDAPISGGAAKAAEGALTVMASGAPEAFAAAEPVLDAVAETVFRLGDAPGAAAAMKVVNQHLAGIHIASAAEAVVFGITQGIPPAQVLEVISRCAGTSWMFENRVPHIVAGDYTPLSAVDIFVKDLGIVLEAAGAAGFSPALAQAAAGAFRAAQAQGLGREDDAAVAKVFARQAGVALPGAV